MPERVPLRVLLIEDSDDDALLVTNALKCAGYDVQAYRVTTAAEMRAGLQNSSCDVVIADYTLPHFDVVGALAVLQASGLDIPFIIVSGTIDEEQAVAALRAGAHDFVTKGNLARLVPAIERERREAASREQRRQAQALLREQQASFQLLFESNPLPMWVYDAETLAFLEVNQAAVGNYGYSRDEFLQMDITGIGPAEDIPALLASLKSQRSDFRPAERHWRHRLKDGRVINVEIMTHTLAFRGRDAVFVVAYDITERFKAESSLRASEERFRQLAENIRQAFWLEDAREARLLYVSPAYAEIWGRSLQSMYDDPHSFLEAVHPEDYERVAATLPQQLAGQNTDIEYRVLRPDGQRWIWDRRFPLLDEHGHVYRIAGIAEDITERVKAAEALHASEAELRALFAAMTDVILVLDAEGRCVKLAPTNPRTLYLSGEEVLGKTAHEFLPAEQADLLVEHIRTALADHDLVRYEWGFSLSPPPPHWGGVEMIWFEATVSPMGDGTVVFIAHDITDRKQAEADLHAADQRAIQDYARLVERLADLAQAVGTAPDLTAIYQALRGFIEIETPTNGMFVSLFDAERQERTCVYAYSEGQVEDVSTLPVLPMTGSPASRAIANREIIVIDDYQVAAAGLPGVNIGMEVDPSLPQSSLAAPMLVLGRVIGGFEIQSTQPAAYTPQHVTAVRMAANLAAIATDNLRLLERERQLRREAEVSAGRISRQFEQLAGLRAIDTAITSSMDLRLTFAVLLEQVTAQLGVHAADVLLLSPHSLELTLAARRGFGANTPRHIRQRLGEGHAGQAALERRLVTVPNLREASPAFRRTGPPISDEFVSYYGVPLIAKGEVKGVLEVFHRDLLSPDADWLEYLQMLASQAAIAIDNAQLFDGLQSKNAELTLSYDATIEGWSRALDLRDKETEGHSQRVTELTLQLARAMGMSEAELVHARRGALLHDMGKLGIPDHILLKPEPLTGDEWVIMRQHPTFAYELLSPITFLRPALDIPHCHHEKWDGGGYPRGLRGEQIPLAARLFAVVDVWDALRSDRPYRPAWATERVLDHIRSLSGSHFDPRAVDVFLQVVGGD